MQKWTVLTYPITSFVSLPIERDVLPECWTLKDSFWVRVEELSLYAFIPFVAMEEDEDHV